MRIAIFSDVLPALEAVLADIGASGVEATYVLGDLVGYAPCPTRCSRAWRPKRSRSLWATTTMARASSATSAGARTPILLRRRSAIEGSPGPTRAASTRRSSARCRRRSGSRQTCCRAAKAGAEIGREQGELWGRELSLRSLAHAEWKLGRPENAEDALLECLRIDRELDDRWHLAWSTEALGWIAVDTDQFERGARLLGIAEGLWAQTGSRLAAPWQAWHTAATDRLWLRLGARRLSAEIEAGRRMSRADGLAFGLGEGRAAAEATVAGRPALSERELEVAALVTTGLGKRDIAEKLFLSPRTVEKHVEHIMDKLDLGSRAEIAAWLPGGQRSRGPHRNPAQGWPDPSAAIVLEPEVADV